MGEVWKAVPGFEGLYEVSDWGRVRSLDRVLTHPTAKRGYPRRVKGRVLAPQKHSGGYAQVTLSGQLFLVHAIVARAFLGPCPSGQEVCHDDGDKRNNAEANLRYDVHTANCADRERHGTQPIGERNGAAKLTAEHVLSIRSRAAESSQALAAEFGVHPHHVDRIIRRERWAHV